MPIEIIRLAEREKWNKAVMNCGQHDIYHTHDYHAIAQRQGEGEPLLLLCEDKGCFAAVPMLLRSISDIEGFEDCSYTDAVSVYGYPGVISSIDSQSRNAAEFRNIFQQALLDALKELKVVSLFSRLHPMIPTEWLLTGLGELEGAGTTVVVDLSMSDKAHWSAMRKGHRSDLLKGARQGLQVFTDEEFAHLEDFIVLYNETMRKNKARTRYYFPQDYYLQLKQACGNKLKLYVAKYEGAIVSAALFFMHSNIIQYHLCGSITGGVPGSAAKSIIYEVCRWGRSHGFRWLHLGGGVGGAQDSLYQFKVGFSKDTLAFHTFRGVIEPSVYNELCERKQAVVSSFFPIYRGAKEEMFSQNRVYSGQ